MPYHVVAQSCVVVEVAVQSLGRAVHLDVSGQFVSARAQKLGKLLASLVEAKVRQGAHRASLLEIGSHLISVDVEKYGVRVLDRVRLKVGGNRLARAAPLRRIIKNIGMVIGGRWARRVGVEVV